MLSKMLMMSNFKSYLFIYEYGSIKEIRIERERERERKREYILWQRDRRIVNFNVKEKCLIFLLEPNKTFPEKVLCSLN